ncbi:MAG TPA: ATP-binding protein [Actinomycetota bacterium]|nr:ATP-binding protein [Actinomycetota bacterium]
MSDRWTRLTQARWSSRPEVALRLAVAVALPALATLIASPRQVRGASGPTNAALLYLLAVVAAAVVARLPGGLLASVESFLGLNFFFTPPERTFAVAKSPDLLALIVFLVVSILVATLLAKTLAQRAQAEQGEREALLLYRISSDLLGRDALPSALAQFAGDLVDMFALARCEVTAVQPGGAPALSAAAGAPEAAGSTPVSLPLKTERGTFGEVIAYPKAGGQMDERQRSLAGALAGQVALAVEAAMLAEQTRHSQAEAEASRARAALFSSVTHDLRTPLAAIKASATSLLDGGVDFDDAQRTDLLTTIAEESDHLNRLIANLLGLSRLRAGALVPEKTAAPVEDVIEAAVTRLRRRSKGVAIRIQVAQPSGTIPAVPMDLLQIDQVVTNLLENAVKYRGNDLPVEVTATVAGRAVEVAVSDHGPGIAPEDRERVFAEFYRRDTGGGQGGVGLGLAIAKAIVEVHGGSVFVRDTPGGGATVGFRLPLGDPSSLGEAGGPPVGAPVPADRVAS